MVAYARPTSDEGDPLAIGRHRPAADLAERSRQNLAQDELFETEVLIVFASVFGNKKCLHRRRTSVWCVGPVQEKLGPVSERNDSTGEIVNDAVFGRYGSGLAWLDAGRTG